MKHKKPLGIIVGALLSVLIAYQQGFADSHTNEAKNNQRKPAPAYQTPKMTHHQSNQQANHQSKTANNSAYSDALRLLWTKVYKDKGTTLYCDKPFSTRSRAQRKRANVNAEHVFPMAWVTKDLGCGTRKQCQANSEKFRMIESDLHNIYPARMDVNKARSNFRFGTVRGEPREFGRCDMEVDAKHRVAEPPAIKRGELARAMLYLAYQYDLSLKKKTRQRLVKWDREDPPSAEEKRRERIIRQVQGRENPFITRHPFSMGYQSSNSAVVK